MAATLPRRMPTLARSLTASAAPRIPLLSRLRIANDAEAMSSAGFAVGAGFNIGGVAIEMDAPGGHNSWAWKDGVGSSKVDCDGIATEVEGFHIFGQSLDYTRTPPHPNQACALYSIIVSTPDLQRTVDAFSTSLGAPRTLSRPSPDISMAFFQLGSPSGPVIVEVVAPSTPGTAIELPAEYGGEALSITNDTAMHIVADRDAAAAIVGIVVVAPTLDHLPTVLGEGCVGEARPATRAQGRMIAPVRHGQLTSPLGRGVSLAFITPPDHAALQARAKRGGGVGLSSVLSIAD